MTPTDQITDAERVKQEHELLLSEITPDAKVIKTYVWHQGKCFFVSTIERDSSAMQCPGRFNETMVWEYDWKTAERGAWIFQDGCAKGSIRLHQQVVERLYATGNPNEPETE